MIGARLALVLLAGASAAAAQGASSVRAERLACDRGVQLVSEGAGLYEVLGQLSRTLAFEMHYWAGENPPIRIDTRQSPLDLMRELSTHANVIARYRADPHCPGRLAIDAVWVVPGGTAALATPSAPPVRPPPAAPPAAAPQPTPVDPAQQEYLRAHGLLPPAVASPEARR
jgi:hypothetical protein